MFAQKPSTQTKPGRAGIRTCRRGRGGGESTTTAPRVWTTQPPSSAAPDPPSAIATISERTAVRRAILTPSSAIPGLSPIRPAGPTHPVIRGDAPTYPPAMRYQPQLATLVKAAPDGDEWLHEIKYDGYRIGCVVERGRVRLTSRNGKDWTEAFPPIVAAARDLGVDRAILDGEAAILTADGRTSFQALQNWFAGGGEGLVYFAFDLLALDGEAHLETRPLEQRKEILQRLLAGARGGGCLRFSDHVVGGGARFLAAACRRGLEGIVSKRRSDPHRPGRTT